VILARYLKFGMWFVLLLLMHEVGMTWPYAVLTGFYLIYELTGLGAGAALLLAHDYRAQLASAQGRGEECILGV
jgi:hypothetical protein